jgi:hypothetical protein
MDTPREIFLINRLAQVADDAVREGARTIGVIGVGSDEDCRNCVSDFDQVFVELDPGHPRHMDVSDKTGRFKETRRREKIDCRCVRLDIVAQGPHEPSHGIAKGRIILNERDQ